jgi:Bacterial SH3 domain
LEKKIALCVGLAYLVCSLVIFRGVIGSIPQIWRGEAVINGDELVPFFNPQSQLIDQAAGKFNQLTNGYEFRVRYSILTTWMRYYKVLPIAIPLVIPGMAFAAYLAVSWFLATCLSHLPRREIYLTTAAPVAVMFLILSYAKITHFYTLILGFSLFTIACALVTYGLIFADEHPYRPIAAACLVTLLNPAVHYLILFALYLGITVLVLLVMEILAFLRSGGLRRLRQRTWRMRRVPSSGAMAARWRTLSRTTTVRCMLAFVLFAVLALVPYGLLVKFVFLRGVPNISETVPGDFYFITDASISIGHVIAFDMAGIMDKMITGDYLSKEPRYPNALYTALLLMPLFLPQLRRTVFNTRPRRLFLSVAYVNVFFSMWATLGYSDPQWLPTFHRTIAAISQAAYGMQSTQGDLIVRLTSTIVQVLRFPHRFQLILFMMACLLIPISLVWIVLQARRVLARRAASSHWPKWGARMSRLVLPVVLVVFFVPVLSIPQYRETFLSGNFHNFLAPYPVGRLQEVKRVLLSLPPGKVVVLPPTETAKVIVDASGVEHKFIDKFHLYYLDLPGYYYGLTGDSDNKYEFFLLLRSLYYQQNWWVNIARDLDIRYIVVNKELAANPSGGAEYLREIEKLILPELDGLTEYLRMVYENDGYSVYEFTDLPLPERLPLFIDTDWTSFIQVLTQRPDLTRCFDLRHAPVSDDLTGNPQLLVLTDDVTAAALDLYIKSNPKQFTGPSSSMYAFSPNIIPSSYYLSPMFRLFQFFSDSKWNRLNMITPGLFGTINGSFIGVPRATTFRIDVRFPEAGKYRLLLRGAATVNVIDATAKRIGYRSTLNLRTSGGALAFFAQPEVFTPDRKPLNISKYTMAELERLIPSDIVAVNNRFQYYDMGTVSAPKGAIPFYFSKRDNNPLLVEGVLAIPEETFQGLTLPANAQQVRSVADLSCEAVPVEGAGQGQERIVPGYPQPTDPATGEVTAVATAAHAPTLTPTTAPTAPQTPTPAPTVAPTVTPTVVPTVTPSSTMAQPTGGLAPGDKARVITAVGVNVRNLASTEGTLIGRLPRDAMVTVLEGPVRADDYSWWKVDNGAGLSGWVAAGPQDDPWLVRVTDG